MEERASVEVQSVEPRTRKSQSRQILKSRAELLNYKYNGKELQETGMYDYGARMYMPDLGRFGTQDPMQVFDMWQSSYSYANNNPILYQDEYGLGILNVIGNLFERAARAIGSIFNNGCSCNGSSDSIGDAFRRPDFNTSSSRSNKNVNSAPSPQNNNSTQSVTPIASNSVGITMLNFSVNIPNIDILSTSPPTVGIPDINPSPTRPPLPTNVEFDRDINFNINSLGFYNKALTEKTLYDLISTLQEHAELKLIISGNTAFTSKDNNNTSVDIDGKPSNIGNLKLGRAKAIMKLLIKKGINADRILIRKGKTTGDASTTFKLLDK